MSKAVKTTPLKAEPRLTPRQRLFVDAYIANGWNGVQAARSAGYSGSVATLTVAASKLVRLGNIKAALSAEYERFHISKEQVLARLGQVANAKLPDYVGADGRLKRKAYTTNGYPVKKLKRGKGVLEMELHDPLRALELVGKAQGMFKDVVQVGGEPGGEPVRVMADLPQEAVDACAAKEVA